MVIDTSAILAWLKDEPDRDRIEGHPAQLNMGDCAVYALAKMVNEPLLFVGNDFSQTDIEPC